MSATEYLLAVTVAVGLLVIVGSVVLSLGVAAREATPWVDEPCVCAHDRCRHQMESDDGACDEVGCSCPRFTEGDS